MIITIGTTLFIIYNFIDVRNKGHCTPALPHTHATAHPTTTVTQHDTAARNKSGFRVAKLLFTFTIRLFSNFYFTNYFFELHFSFKVGRGHYSIGHSVCYEVIF